MGIKLSVFWELGKDFVVGIACHEAIVEVHIGSECAAFVLNYEHGWTSVGCPRIELDYGAMRELGIGLGEGHAVEQSIGYLSVSYFRFRSIYIEAIAANIVDGTVENGQFALNTVTLYSEVTAMDIGVVYVASGARVGELYSSPLAVKAIVREICEHTIHSVTSNQDFVVQFSFDGERTVDNK